jgi:hypothetical protein
VRSLVSAVGVCLTVLGCASAPDGSVRRFPASVLRAVRFEARPSGRRPARGDESAAFVERALRRLGLHFGTDGSVGALWGYLRTSHRLVAPSDARPGDVVLFDVHGTGPEPTCADHAGIVEAVGSGGRIAFVEARGGSVRHSFVDPRRPTVRRDESGAIVNSFLRPKRITDPIDARYFAGEMLCAIVRLELPTR